MAFTNNLTEAETDKLMTLLADVQSQNFEAGIAFLRATNWDVVAALDKWFENKGDPSLLSTSTPQNIDQLPNSETSNVDPMNQGRSTAQNSVLASDENQSGGQGAYVTNAINEQSTSLGKEWQGAGIKRREHLVKIFQDPHFKYKSSWNQAKTDGQRQKKWILLNIQATGEFASHALNRDVWNKPQFSVWADSHFLFFQLEKSTSTARKLCMKYQIKKFPHVSIINPSTGEQKSIIQLPPIDKFPNDAAFIFLQLINWSKQVPEVVSGQGSKNNEVINVSQPSLQEMKKKETSAVDQPSTNENMDQEKSVDSGKKESNINKDKDTIPPVTPDPEPSISDPEATVLRIRLPHGSLISRRFKKSAFVEDVYRFVSCSCNKENVSLVQTMPFLKLNDQKNKTLQELNLDKVTLVCSYE